MNARASALTPVSLIAVGILMVVLASLAVIQSRGISVSPASTDSSTLFEPKGGQISLFAPPYCNTGIVCRALDRVITVFRRLSARFPFLAPLFARVIARLQAIQARMPASTFFVFN